MSNLHCNILKGIYARRIVWRELLEHSAIIECMPLTACMPTRKHSRTAKQAPRTTPTMTPAMLADDRWVLLLVLPRMLSLLRSDTGTVAFKSLIPGFPAKSLYVPAVMMIFRLTDPQKKKNSVRQKVEGE